VVFTVAAALSLVAALASLMRGGRVRPTTDTITMETP
jgi:hypothetical protein